MQCVPIDVDDDDDDDDDSIIPVSLMNVLL